MAWGRSWRRGPGPGTILSALLVAVAHPPLELHPLLWIGLVPWLLTLVRCSSWRGAVAQGLWLSFLLGLGEAFWLVYAIPNYLGVSLAAGILGTILHAAVHQLHLAVFAPVFRWLAVERSPGIAPLCLLEAALLYAGLEWATPNVFQNDLGFLLHDYRSIRQLAELGGSPLLTFLVLVVNLGVFFVVRAAAGSGSLRRALPAAGLAAALLAGAWALGAAREQQVRRAIASPRDRVQVGVVQGNVSGTLKRDWARGDSDAAKEVVTRYVRASQELLETGPRPDFVLWPETAYPGIFRKPENEVQAEINVALDKYIAQSQTPFVFGAYDREDRLDRRVLRNAIFLVTPEPGQSIRTLSPMQVYHKYVLFPVGEYLPFGGEPFGGEAVRRWLPNGGALSAGAGPRILDLDRARGGRIRLGPSICYEDLFPAHPIALARLGADLIVNVSDDSWFGDLGLPRLHLMAAKMRSIETRLPQVRATNTGYSALILPDGDVLEVSAYDTYRALRWTVPLIARIETPMVRWGEWFGAASLFLSICALPLLSRARR